MPPADFDFRAWRRRLGLSQDGAARALDVSRSQIQNWERGRVGDREVRIDRRTELACRYLERALARKAARSSEHS